MVKIYCHNCSKKCVGDVLKVGEKYFHQKCFSCKDCSATLDAGGFFFRNDNYYCPVDYTNRFSNKCFICGNIISSEVVSALNHHFHRECFKCSKCSNTFAPGNRVTMKNNQFICSLCLNQNDQLPNNQPNPVTAPKDIFYKSGDKIKNKDIMSDESITDQGYISADPTSLSSPTQIEEDDFKTQSYREPNLRKHKSRSSATRSLFDFGQFYNSSYLDIQAKQQKERQSQSKNYSSRSAAKSFLSSNSRQQITSKRPVKSQYNDISSLLCGNRLSANSNLKVMSTVSETDVNEKENVIRLSSYPAGEKHPDNIPYPIERDDWPAPLSTAILLQEKKRRKENFFGHSMQCELNQLPTDNLVDYSQSLDHLAMTNAQNPQRSLIEVIKTSPRHNDRIHNHDVISASRSPSANIEPIRKPRFTNHNDISKSRDSTYFDDPDRHHGYSLDFISSTNRPFLVGKSPYNMYKKSANNISVHPLVRLKPGYTKGLLYDLKINALLKNPTYGEQTSTNNNNVDAIIQNSLSNPTYSWMANRTMSDTFDVQLKNSEYDLTLDEIASDNVDELTSSEIDLVTGLKSTKNKYSKERVKELTLTSGRSSINSRIESLETWSFWSHKPAAGSKPPIISFSDLVSKDPKMMKYLDMHKLETYLSTDEFQRLFKLNRSEFYKLPEWKQNDLKRRINLF